MQVRPMGAAGDAGCGRWAVASAPLPCPGAPLPGRPAAETLAWSWHVMTPSRRAGTAHLMQGRSGSRPPSRRPPGEAEALRRAARPRAEQPGMRGLGVASAASAALERRAGGEGLQRERWGAGLLPCEERNAGEERRGARLCLSTGRASVSVMSPGLLHHSAGCSQNVAHGGCALLAYTPCSVHVTGRIPYKKAVANAAAQRASPLTRVRPRSLIPDPGWIRHMCRR